KEGLEPCYSVSSVSDWESLAYGDIPTSSDSSWDAATCDFAKTGYRLPTEAEWEYAARGGIETTTERAWAGTANSAELGDYAWYGVNSESKTHEVKKKKPNGYGLYDMSGNVFEWCWDWWPNTGDYADDKDGATDPAGPSSGSFRVKRGGSWDDTAQRCAVSDRTYYSPDYLYDDLGFRVVRSSSE
ncbi:MAG: formylglycine-generating enzyme family protein, partial [Treponema sp.]|nr:formylglycine-generating enzyme family protein [Treponema sp.]